MRICLIVDCYLPSTKSSAKLMSDLAGEFAGLGHEPVVVVPDDSLGRAEGYRLCEEGGVTVLRIRSGRIKGASLVKRAMNEAMLSWVLWRGGRKYFRRNPCDLVVFYSPSIFFGGVVGKLKKLWGCPAYMILRDIFPQWAVDAGVLRSGGPAWRFFRKRELAQYRVADVIAVQSPANLEYFSQAPELADKHRLEVLYNWTKTDEHDVPQGNYRGDLGLEGKTVYFYGGNIGVAQDMDNIIRLAESLGDRTDICFLLVGDGSEVARLERLIAEKGLTNIRIHPPVGQREYLGMLREFDVGLISLAANLTTQNVPGKLLGYMYYGMPVLASINPGNDLQEILESHDAALVSINGQDAEFRDNALRLADDTELRERMGGNSRGLLEERFSVSRAASQVLSSCESLAAGGPRDR